MVANDAKPMALSKPMSKAEVDENWNDFEQIAKEWKVEIWRETDFPVTPLWSESSTEGKEVVVVSTPPRLTQYQQLKSELNDLEPMKAARRFGRLLGYSPQGINRLLMKNSEFKTLNSFKVSKQITHLYYENLEEARLFYSDVLGLQETSENQFSISNDALIELHSSNELHPTDQPKSTAIAFLTDQLPEWYNYVQEKEVPIKYTYKPREGGPHDGFVAIDPGGYLLEFEEFKQHPENELFIAHLAGNPRIETKIDSLSFYGSITWTYHNDMLKMQQFYEEALGFQMVADQGWTKIYKTSDSGYIGLVDERRGMMDYADEKAIEIEWQVKEIEEATQYFTSHESWESDQVLIGPERYRYFIR